MRRQRALPVDSESDPGHHCLAGTWLFLINELLNKPIWKPVLPLDFQVVSQDANLSQVFDVWLLLASYLQQPLCERLYQGFINDPMHSCVQELPMYLGAN
jgi:hypothetical protein